MNSYINNVSWGISLVLRQTASKQVTLKPQFPPKKNNEIPISASVNGYTL